MTELGGIKEGSGLPPTSNHIKYAAAACTVGTVAIAALGSATAIVALTAVPNAPIIASLTAAGTAVSAMFTTGGAVELIKKTQTPKRSGEPLPEVEVIKVEEEPPAEITPKELIAFAKQEIKKHGETYGVRDLIDRYEEPDYPAKNANIGCLSILLEQHKAACDEKLLNLDETNIDQVNQLIQEGQTLTKLIMATRTLLDQELEEFMSFYRLSEEEALRGADSAHCLIRQQCDELEQYVLEMFEEIERM